MGACCQEAVSFFWPLLSLNEQAQSQRWMLWQTKQQGEASCRPGRGCSMEAWRTRQMSCTWQREVYRRRLLRAWLLLGGPCTAKTIIRHIYVISTNRNNSVSSPEVALQGGLLQAASMLLLARFLCEVVYTKKQDLVAKEEFLARLQVQSLFIHAGCFTAKPAFSGKVFNCCKTYYPLPSPITSINC